MWYIQLSESDWQVGNHKDDQNLFIFLEEYILDQNKGCFYQDYDTTPFPLKLSLNLHNLQSQYKLCLLAIFYFFSSIPPNRLCMGRISSFFFFLFNLICHRRTHHLIIIHIIIRLHYPILIYPYFFISSISFFRFSHFFHFSLIIRHTFHPLHFSLQLPWQNLSN